MGESITVHPVGDSAAADDTHLSERGARRMVELVLDGIEELELGPAISVVRDDR